MVLWRGESNGLVSELIFGVGVGGDALPDNVLLDELQASGSASLVSFFAEVVSTFFFIFRRRTSFSAQCHMVNISNIPNKTKLYVFKNFRLKSIASTIFLNRGSLPGSSGSTSLPPPAVVRMSSLSTGHDTSVDAVACKAKRKTFRNHGLSAMISAMRKVERQEDRDLYMSDCRDIVHGVPRARVIYAGRYQMVCVLG